MIYFIHWPEQEDDRVKRGHDEQKGAYENKKYLFLVMLRDEPVEQAHAPA